MMATQLSAIDHSCGLVDNSSKGHCRIEGGRTLCGL